MRSKIGGLRAAAMAAYYAGRDDQAIDQLRKTLLLDPAFIGAHAALGRAYQQKQSYAEAIAEFQQALQLSQGDSNEHGDAGAHDAAAGRHVAPVVLVGRVRNLAVTQRPEFEIARRLVVPVNRPTLFHCLQLLTGPPSGDELVWRRCI